MTPMKPVKKFQPQKKEDKFFKKIRIIFLGSDLTPEQMYYVRNRLNEMIDKLYWERRHNHLLIEENGREERRQEEIQR